MIERRFSKGAEVRAAETPAKDPLILGYAAVFNEPYVMYEDRNYRVVEYIAPGAFTPVLNTDVRCLYNHNANFVLGRSSSGTLALSQDDKGLAFNNTMDPESGIARDVYRAIKRGDVQGCSFAFTVGKESVTREKVDGKTVITRTIESLDGLYDVGPVTYPAYEQTSVNARELRSVMDELPLSVRTAMQEKDPEPGPTFDLEAAKRHTRQIEIELGL